MLELVLQTFTLPPLHQQEAWFWIPIMIAGTLLATVIIIARSGNTETEPLKGKTLGVLGMPESGKTQFLMNLRGIKYKSYQQTSVDEYKTFIFKIGDRQIKIEGGKDIGGSEHNIRSYYEKFLKEKDNCIFLFNIQKYKDEPNYRKDTNARLDFINNHVTDHSKFAIIGTHVDQARIKKGENIVAIVQAMVTRKPYARLFNINFFASNLLEKDDMHTITRKLLLEDE